MSDGQKTPKKRKTGLEVMRENAIPRSRTSYDGVFFGPVDSAVQDEKLPVTDEHSSNNEQAANMSDHEQSSETEQALSTDFEQTLSRQNEQASEPSPVFTDSYVRAFLAKTRISPKYPDIFAFIHHCVTTVPGQRIGRVIYEEYLSKITYITMRRGLEFWQRAQAISIVQRDAQGTIWAVDPVFTRVLKEYYRFPVFPKIDIEQFTSGLKFRKPIVLKNEQGSLRILDRENNINTLSISNLENTDIAECWPNLSKAGFAQIHLKQIEKSFMAQGLDLSDIPMFMRFIEYELENGTCKDKQGNPVNDIPAWFVVCMRKGYYRRPNGYIDPRVYAEDMRIQELKAKIDRECELKYLENEAKVENMKKMVELVQNDLAENGVRSAYYMPAKKIAGPMYDLITRLGDSAWKSQPIGSALRSACIKGLITIDLVNDAPIINPGTTSLA